uniref:Secreted peptide n=1 Tax=Rhipicephalus pulchellus TaxID=72859 RepID=L7M0K1_RHIPC
MKAIKLFAFPFAVLIFQLGIRCNDCCYSFCLEFCYDIFGSVLKHDTESVCCCFCHTVPYCALCNHTCVSLHSTFFIIAVQVSVHMT